MTAWRIDTLFGKFGQVRGIEFMRIAIVGTPKVLFDGSCPICRREISFYQRQRGAADLLWIDVSQIAEGEVIPGLSRQRARSRFHLLDETGVLRSGGAAFAALWLRLPGFKWLGRLCRLPPLAWALEQSYRLFLKFRPKLQRLLDERPR